MSEEEKAWRWQEVQNLLLEYNHCKKVRGSIHPRALAVKKELDDARNAYYDDHGPEERAQHLARLVHSKERAKATKLQRLSEAQLRLHSVEHEMAEVQARRDAAAQAIEVLHGQIAALDQCIEDARQKRVDVLQQASQEAQWEPAAAAASEARAGNAEFLMLLEQLKRHGNVPGVEQLLTLHSGTVGEQSCPRGEAQSGGRPPPQRKRGADRAATKPSEDDMQDVLSDGPGHGPESPVAGAFPPVGPPPADEEESFSSAAAAQHARNVAARWSHRQDHWDGPPVASVGSPPPGGALVTMRPRRAEERVQEAAGRRETRKTSPEEPERGRDRSRPRQGRRGAQQRSTSAIALYQEHYRAQQRSAAAAAALVQKGKGVAQGAEGMGCPPAAATPPTAADAVPLQAEVTVYDDSEYYAVAAGSSEVRQSG